MNTSRTVISSLVFFSALGVAGALALGAAMAGGLFASLGVGVLAVSDYKS